MEIEWTKKTEKSFRDWHYGKTRSRFRVEVGPNTDKKYSWLIFHADFKHVVHGDSADTIDEAKAKAVEWLKTMAMPGD